jgi:hypothetical protein
MDHHAIVVGVSAVAVGVPVLLFYVGFHVTPDQADALHLQQRVPEIRTRGDPRPARIHNTNPSAGFRAQLRLPYRPLFPKLGQQRFWDSLIFFLRD